MLNVLLVAFLLSVHPVHVSLASIEYVPEKQAFDVFVKVWKDDFISDYLILVGVEPRSGLPGSSGFENDDIEKYINEKIQILADQKKLTGVIEKVEIDEMEIKVYLSYKYEENSDNITIRNFIMTELYKDQSNMLIFKYYNIEEGIKFTSDKQEQTFTIK